MKQVRDLMAADCKTVTEQDNIYEAAVIMAQNDIGFVPVVDASDRSKLVGAVTDRDIVIRGYAEKKPGSSSIQEVMSGQLVSISPDKSAQEAADLMAEHQIRRLPVVENGRLVGVISLGDLAIARTTEDEAGHALSEISEHDHQGQTYLQ